MLGTRRCAQITLLGVQPFRSVMHRRDAALTQSANNAFNPLIALLIRPCCQPVKMGVQ